MSLRDLAKYLALSLIAAGPTIAVEPAAAPAKVPHAAAEVYACPVPPGFQAEKDRRTEAWLSDAPSSRGGDGWYATYPAPMRVDYSAPYPVLLDLEATPMLVGALWGGPGFGDIIDRRMVCGHSMEPHGWNVLVQAYGDGFATIDVRDGIADQPLPTAEGQHEIAPHAFAFEIGDTRYQFLLTGVTAGLTKVWRPDLVSMGDRFGLPKKHPDSSDPEAVWPVLDRFGGVLLAAGLPASRMEPAAAKTVRNAEAIKTAMMGRDLLYLDSIRREQPVDLTGTPYYHGRFMGVEEAHPGEPDPEAEFTFIPEGETLLVQRKGGEIVRVDLAGWIDRQAADIYVDGALTQVAISTPLLEFEYDGAKVKYVLNMVWTHLVEIREGQARYEVQRISGDLFADRPLF